jgi:hypothetical protein
LSEQAYIPIALTSIDVNQDSSSTKLALLDYYTTADEILIFLIKKGFKGTFSIQNKIQL